MTHDCCAVRRLGRLAKQLAPGTVTADEDVDTFEGAVSSELQPRAADAFRTLRGWFSHNGMDGVVDSLQPGVEGGFLFDRVAGALGVPALPDSIKAVYSVHNGQALPYDSVRDSGQNVMGAAARDSLWWGIMGGYSVYDHYVNVRLLSLERGLSLSQALPNFQKQHPSKLCVAASFNLNKFFFADCATGQLFVSTAVPWELLPAAPDDGMAKEELEDSFLRWLERHARNLEFYEIAQAITTSTAESSLRPASTRQLCLFTATQSAPDLAGHLPGHFSELTTAGVKVTASSIFTPELCQLNVAAAFAYQVTMTCLDSSRTDLGEEAESVQLESRHWRILDACDPAGTENHVDGPGVVGLYPLLSAGGPAFQYCSQTSAQPGPGEKLSEAGALMSGSFSFVRGSLADPSGAFDAAIGPFALFVPEFIY